MYLNYIIVIVPIQIFKTFWGVPDIMLLFVHSSVTKRQLYSPSSVPFRLSQLLVLEDIKRIHKVLNGPTIIA